MLRLSRANVGHPAHRRWSQYTRTSSRRRCVGACVCTQHDNDLQAGLPWRPTRQQPEQWRKSRGIRGDTSPQMSDGKGTVMHHVPPNMAEISLH